MVVIRWTQMDSGSGGNQMDRNWQSDGQWQQAKRWSGPRPAAEADTGESFNAIGLANITCHVQRGQNHIVKTLRESESQATETEATETVWSLDQAQCDTR